jgi:hypothetical protein
VLLEALGAGAELFALKMYKYNSKKTPVGFERHAYGMEAQLVAIGMLVHGANVQGGGPQTET